MSHDIILQLQGWTIPHKPYGLTDFKSVASLKPLVFTRAWTLPSQQCSPSSLYTFLIKKLDLARYCQLSKIYWISGSLSQLIRQDYPTLVLRNLIPTDTEFEEFYLYGRQTLYQFRHGATKRYLKFIFYHVLFYYVMQNL